MNDKRDPDPVLMCPDGRHPNHIGLRRMFKRWIQLHPPVGNVDVRFHAVIKYPVGQLE